MLFTRLKYISMSIVVVVVVIVGNMGFTFGNALFLKYHCPPVCNIRRPFTFIRYETRKCYICMYVKRKTIIIVIRMCLHIITEWELSLNRYLLLEIIRLGNALLSVRGTKYIPEGVYGNMLFIIIYASYTYMYALYHIYSFTSSFW